ncbi:histidinol-phosphate transaminase [Mucisphaera calidilacus]|uniref:Histidinol-phosphate aminotransferase n=1 Tax=Mucisphaera calidilacus TaxID=2527982 RepID=A0A518BXH0_9BACT|nr:histidinol-phosphate transaminase [Mucisphaera calidilacus]QDU71665.1 Histidinol-phosphate aminotransferase [Mucisphaera calidilacus]
MAYERPNITALSAYVSGEQPADGRTIKLNTNESPYPPAPKVLEAIATITGESLRRYPPPTAAGFRAAAAQVHGLDASQVFATNAGDELLRLVLTVFTDPDKGGRGIAITEPTYSLYRVLAGIHGASVTATPLDEEFSIPSTWATTLAGSDVGVAFVVNPHAPSGRLESLDTLRGIAEALRGRGVLLIDEAYVDFAEQSALPLLTPDSGLDNVLILRTLSKGYGLAGLRFGYGLGHPDLIASLDKARDSFNTDVIAQAAAEAAIRDQADAREKWSLIVRDRALLRDALRARGFVVPETQTNFVLATVPPAGPDARSIYEDLKAAGILVRYFDQDRLRDKLRITVGTPEQNNTLLAALDRILKTEKV